MRTILSVLVLLIIGCASIQLQPDFVVKVQGDRVNQAIQKKQEMELEGRKAKIILKVFEYKGNEDVFVLVKYKDENDQLQDDCVDQAIQIKKKYEAKGYKADILLGILKYPDGEDKAHAVVDYDSGNGKKRDYNY